jgi:hypothetical protein
VDRTSAEESRGQSSDELLEVIEQVFPSGTVSDGGTTGPFPCRNEQAGLEFYTVRWILDLGDATLDDVLQPLDVAMSAKGYGVDRSLLDAVRPTVVYRDGRRELSVTRYVETGLIQFALDTPCGAPAE